MVKDVKLFSQAVSECMEFTAETDSIVTLGIRPTAPETGYGYIEADLSYASSCSQNIFRVDSFKENHRSIWQSNMSRKIIISGTRASLFGAYRP